MTDNLATALAAFQAEMPTVAKSNRAEVPTKSGGKYTYTYADLADVTQSAMPLLAKNGLSFICCPRATDRGYELVGTLLHASGEAREGSLPIAGNSPQEMGSSLTYMRRYLLGCMTGLVTDDDDDGQLAQAARARKPRAAASAPPANPETGEAVTAPQIAKMGAMMRELGMTDRRAVLTWVSDLVERPVESRNDLTKSEARKVIDALEKEGK